MRQAIKQFLKKSMPYEASTVNRILVSTFVAINRLQTLNDFIESYIISEKNHPEEICLFAKFYNLISSNCNTVGLEELIEFFEFVISPAEKEVNGAVYTPLYIREYIVEEVLKRYSDAELLNIKIGDLSCGCGGFFITAAVYIYQRTRTPLNEIISNFYGVDIASYSIERTRIILNLLCLTYNEEVIVHPNLTEI